MKHSELGEWYKRDDICHGSPFKFPSLTRACCVPGTFQQAGAAAVSKTNCINSLLVHKRADKLKIIYDDAKLCKDNKQARIERMRDRAVLDGVVREPS